MKLRGFSAFLIAFLVLVIGLVTSYVIKSENSDSNIAMKSQELNENSARSMPQKLSQGAVAKIKSILMKAPPENNEGFTERKDFSESLVAQERFYTESEISHMSPEAFGELLKITELKLPKISDLKEIPEGALHTTPTPVIQAGKDLGLIKEILKNHSDYEKAAIVFYETCAKNAERPTTIRALCLTNMVEIKKKNGEKVDYKAYPASLVELTKMITDL